MLKRTLMLSGTAILTLLTAGCVSQSVIPEESPAVIAKFVPDGVKPDGKLSDPAWKSAVEYKLEPYVMHTGLPEKSAAAVGKTKYWNDVWAKVLYDKENIYVGVRFESDDIRALQPKDQSYLFLGGDTVEVFLKPQNGNTYFELYMTPSENRTTFVFPSRAYLWTHLLKVQKFEPDLIKVYAALDGTLNDGRDVDRGWTGVMVINRKRLSELSGVKFDEKNPWTILLAGYGYSQNKISGSNFSYPKLPHLNYHLTEYYAPLKLSK